MQKKFKLEQCRESIDYSFYAHILEQSCFWSFLTPSFRRARRLYQNFSLQPCNQPLAMAADLRELHDYFSACKSIEQDKTLQKLCAPHFRGIESNFASLADAAQFGYDMQKRFAHQDPVHQAICLTLLEGDEENLQQLAAYIRHPMASALNYFLSASSDSQTSTLLSNDTRKLGPSGPR